MAASPIFSTPPPEQPPAAASATARDLPSSETSSFNLKIQLKKVWIQMLQSTEVGFPLEI
uniref:Uncharacterized protein n=1 Tax=Oryza punctata TaxID=4537 RepID=A0A0E0JZ81_ORYPU